MFLYKAVLFFISELHRTETDLLLIVYFQVGYAPKLQYCCTETKILSLISSRLSPKTAFCYRNKYRRLISSNLSPQNCTTYILPCVLFTEKITLRVIWFQVICPPILSARPLTAPSWEIGQGSGVMGAVPLSFCAFPGGGRRPEHNRPLCMTGDHE